MISDKDYIISTGFPKIYEELIDEEKIFSRKHHFFVFGLVYGLLHNLRSEKPLKSDYIRLNQIKDSTTNDLIDFAFLLLDTNEIAENKIFEEMLRIADGGIEELKKIYDENNKNFDLQNLIIDAEKLWAKRIHEFNDLKQSSLNK